MLMSGENEKGFIDEILRQKKSKRKGKFNPGSKQISEATEAFLRNGGRIDRTIPDWERDMEEFVNLQADSLDVHNFLMV